MTNNFFFLLGIVFLYSSLCFLLCFYLRHCFDYMYNFIMFLSLALCLYPQQVKGHGGRQQFYPFPPKGITPNLQSRPEEMKVSLRTANVLRNLERSHWMTSYDLDYTGLGPSNPLSLDNLDTKLTTKIMTRLDDDKLVCQ